MITYFKVDDCGVEEASKREANWIHLDQLTDEEMEELISTYRLPEDIFVAEGEPEEITRMEYLKGTNLQHPYSLIVMNLKSEKDAGAMIEDRLAPISCVVSEDLLITHFGDGSPFLRELMEDYEDELTSFETIIAYSVLMIYTSFIDELHDMKRTIDQLDQSARTTTKNEELFQLADAKRNLVYLDHTLHDQSRTIETLLKNEAFVNNLKDAPFLYDLSLLQRQADKLVNIYRDLLESIGGLFNDMMSNNLNYIMKYLDSAALVVAVPSFIVGLWGINTGGLPGKDTELGFIVVMILAVVLAVVTALHLKKKDYSG